MRQALKFEEDILTTKMAEKNVTKELLASVLNISVVSVINKIRKKTAFTIRESKVIKKYLELTDQEYFDYFFDLKGNL